MPVGVGILGFAHGHVQAYCGEWTRHPEHDVAVVAAWDHDAARLRQQANAYGATPHADAADLLSRADVHAVVIGAETSRHADLAEAAATAGKAIVVQKPLALTIPEADRIVDAARRARVPFTVAWQMRADPQNREMKALLGSGEFGRVFTVRRRHGLGTHLWKGFADSWHAQPALNRDIWADDASHPIDFIHWLLGAPTSVTAEIESLHDPRVPSDNGVALFRYPGGPLAEVCCSFTCAAAENTTEIVCERGTIVQNYGDGPSCNVPRPEGAPGLKWFRAGDGRWTASETPSPPDHGARIRALAGPLAEFLHGRAAPLATAEEGRTSLRMLLACYVSSRDGRRVSLDDEAIARV